MRWLRIAISFTVTLLTLLCMLPAQAAQGSGWSVLLDDQGNLQLSDIRSARYTNQFSPIELDRITAAEPDGALWVRFKLQPGKHEQVLRVFAPDLAHLSLYVLDGDTLVYKQYFHIGFAADTPNGLVVPVLRDADKKGVLQISQEMGDLAKKARDGKMGPADMSGGCFSISSLGGIGGTHFTPIINAPEVAILGLSKSQMKPVWDGQQFVPRLMLPLSLSYDHRVIDGAAAARFNAYLGQVLADFRRVLL